MGELILPRKTRDTLGVLHDKFISGDVEGYVVVYVSKDGTTEVNFDLHDSMHMAGLNKIGGGLSAAYTHTVNLAKQLQAKQFVDAEHKRGNLN